MGARAADMTEAALASMVDVAFAVSGDAVPREHRRALAEAIERRLPWLAELAGAGVHRLNVSAGGGPQALLSQRTRLTLRVPRERATEAAALEGAELRLGAATLRIGAAQVRELLPWGTLYAHVVAADAHDDELAFLQAVDAELAALGVDCRPICGRLQVLESGALRGYGLMLEGAGNEADRLIADDESVSLDKDHGPRRFTPVPPATFGA